MQKFSSHLYCIIFLLLCRIAVIAQPEMSVQVDEKTVRIEDFVHIQYTIEKAQKLTKFIPPAFTGFRVIQGPDYTNGWTLINGEMKEYLAIGFVLQPTRKGKFLIQPASAKADGQNIRSGTVTIEVNDQGAGTLLKIDKQPGGQVLNDMILRKGESISQKIKSNLFVKLDISRTSVFVGEPLVATYKLYTRLNSESKVTRRPTFNGFSVFDMADPESGQAQYEKINGREYTVYLLRKVQLFPLQEGKYELEEIQIENTVSFIREDFARDQNTLNGILRAFGEEGIGPAAWVKEDVTISSESKVVTVKALPLYQQPANYAGAVGQFTIQAEVDGKQLAVGDVAKLNITISGSGNLPVMGNPDIKWPEGVEVFEMESKEDLNKTVAPITGKKVTTIPFSPSVEGQYMIPSVEMAVFDPGTGKYVVLKTDSIPINAIAAPVQKTKSLNTTAKPGNDKVDSNQLPWYVLAMSLIAIAGMGVYLFTKRKNRKSKERSDLPGSVNSEGSIFADTSVQQLSLFPHVYSLDKAGEYVYSSKPEAAYHEIEQVIVSVIAERYGISRGESLDNINSGLVRKYVSADLALKTVSLLQDCQVALFNPFIEDSQVIADYEKAKIILDRLQSTSD